MKVLFLGGTQFVGRHMVEAALKQGCEVTLFHRGRTNPGLFEGVEQVFGDRCDDLSKLLGSWDVAVDTSGYFPRALRVSTGHLADRVHRYVFVSTISVYREFSKTGLDESAYVKTLEDPELEEVNASTYGPLKTACEGVVTGVFGERALILRPGVVAGPYDPTDRFTYWAWRMAQGGEALAPESRRQDVQVIDARDLAQFLMHCMREKITGTYNVTGKAYSFDEMLASCRQAAKADTKVSWVPEEFLSEVGLNNSKSLPLWLAPSDVRHRGMFSVDSSAAEKVGLVRRPLEQTARDTLAWANTRPRDYEWETGMSVLKEQEYLQRWRERQG